MTDPALPPPVYFAPDYDEFAQWVREFAAPYADGYLDRAHSEDFPWDLASPTRAWPSC